MVGSTGPWAWQCLLPCIMPRRPGSLTSWRLPCCGNSELWIHGTVFLYPCVLANGKLAWRSQMMLLHQVGPGSHRVTTSLTCRWSRSSRWNRLRWWDCGLGRCSRDLWKWRCLLPEQCWLRGLLVAGGQPAAGQACLWSKGSASAG